MLARNRSVAGALGMPADPKSTPTSGTFLEDLVNHSYNDLTGSVCFLCFPMFLDK